MSINAPLLDQKLLERVGLGCELFAAQVGLIPVVDLWQDPYVLLRQVYGLITERKGETLVADGTLLSAPSAG